MMKWKYERPKFAKRAALKTFLKRTGFEVPRDFYGRACCIAKKNGRLYRFRFQKQEFDISCPLSDFDRWANSTDFTFPFDTIWEMK